MDAYQKKQLDELRKLEAYEDAAVWTILYDLLLDGHTKESINIIIDMIEKEMNENNE